jgi:hypothetical protein
VPAFILPLAPPLVVTSLEIDHLCDAVNSALGEVEGQLGVRAR